MSIVAMKKLTLFAPKSSSDEILSKLIKLQCVEIRREEVPYEDLAPCVMSDKKLALENEISRIERTIEALLPYSKKKFSLVKPKIEVDTEKFMSDGSYELAKKTLDEFFEAERCKRQSEADIKAAEDSISELTPWADLDLPLDFRGTDKTFLIRGSVPASASIDALSERLREHYAVSEKISEDTHGIYITVIGLSEYESEILRTLSAVGFTRAADRASDTTAAGIMFEDEKKRGSAKARFFGYERTIRGLADRLDLLKILYDIEKTELEKAKKHEMMLTTEKAELMHAWVPENRLSDLESLFDKYGCAYEFTDPDEGEDAPVMLKNNKFAENFEWVLALYSLPKYGSFDPTFIMAICYTLLFGLMFADVGYGLVMILGGFLVPKILNPSPWANKFFKSFGYCGIACCIMGVLFGGYFGDFPIAFGRSFLGLDMPDSLAIIVDPVLDSLDFMIIGIAVGAVHLIIGMIIKFNIVRKQESLIAAILSVGSWWVLFAGIALMFLLPTVGPWVLGAGALGIFASGFVSEKKWLMKPFKGLLAFYDIINYASDLLSYSRILALGLTSAVIAQVVNILGTMMGPSVAGFIVMIIAFILGHALNIALNAMGTFVHSARLQYVEFFGKFFEDGGRAFDPVKPNSTYTK
ncbi:MAG: V-type ATP synthase subunit I [Ruminococcaceae bacterium]|nr:V-type ATP synthase subunit I [Oscillospiraceae bacterium]